jgi:Xaa-Pro aminopeptidase
MYDAVRQAHDNAISAVMPGLKARDIDKVARDTIHSAGYGQNFLHSLGHGVGLEVHEAPYLSPKSSATLAPGMVFTIEPGVYVEGVGGVRLESLVHLTDSGPEILNSASKELIHAY